MSALFAITIANAKPKERPYKMFDGGGLHLFVKPNGSKLWLLTYSWLGRQKTLSLGQWPDLGLADARTKREEARRLLATGVDPSHQQKIDAAKAKMEENNTFKAVALEWIAKQEREQMAEVTLSKVRWLLDKAYLSSP
ncbi:MAG: Arm DNA-binding domain-containing protein [Novosphingobium aromaticivorans]|nr:Arm DNA-binding domain-containing protein [Novosphingobium aromaticivorans]